MRYACFRRTCPIDGERFFASAGPSLLVITDITYYVHVIATFHYPYIGRISTLGCQCEARLSVAESVTVQLTDIREMVPAC